MKSSQITKYLLFGLLLIKVIILVSGVYGSYTMGDEWSYLNFAQDLKDGHFYYQNTLAVLLAQQNDIIVPIKYAYWPYDIEYSKFFNNYSIGYPLLLAPLIAVFSFDIVFYVNILFYILVMLGIFYLTKEMARKSRYSDWIALATSILVFTSSLFTNAAINKMATLSSFAFLIWGIYFFLRAFIKEDYKFLLLASFLIGFSISIRVTNILIALPILGYLIFSIKKFFNKKLINNLMRFLLVLIFLLIGLIPFFVQNQYSTGNPFISVYFPRHLSDLRVDHLIPSDQSERASTLWLFTKSMFNKNPVWPVHLFLILMGITLVVFLKNREGLFILVAALLFALFFGLWGRVVQRYFIFVYFVIFFLKSYVLFYFLEFCHNKIKRHFKAMTTVSILLFVIVNPANFYQTISNYLGKYSEIKQISISQGQQVGKEVSAVVGNDRNKVIITGRFAEGILYLYTDIDVYRPQFNQGKLKEAADFIIAQGKELYLLVDGNRQQEEIEKYKQILEENFSLNYVTKFDYFKNNKGEAGQLYKVEQNNVSIYKK